ncbi:hypothetical protein BVRB_1g005910 [Beta vulgaris subsp. vulgaris]|nr:hypothetical protein BVRB_1g005910 [Beta vulgaris subsp. vulgaris]
MLQLKISAAIELKRMIKAISNISNVAYIEVSKDFTLFHATHVTTKVLALLHLSSLFFQDYQITRHIILCVNLSNIHTFFNCDADDDDAVNICSEDENPITVLHFHIHNSSNEKSKMMTLKVKELVAEPWSYEPHHEFKVDIDSNLFKQIAEYSAEYQTPIHITVTSIYIKLASGSQSLFQWSNKGNREFEIKDARHNKGYEIQFPWRVFAKAFILACSIADVVYLKDSYCRTDAPTMLEFSFGRFSRLLFYLRNASLCCTLLRR